MSIMGGDVYLGDESMSVAASNTEKQVGSFSQTGVRFDY